MPCGMAVHPNTPPVQVSEFVPVHDARFAPKYCVEDAYVNEARDVVEFVIVRSPVKERGEEVAPEGNGYEKVS